MSDIVLSAGVRSNLLQLQQTSDLMTRTQTRLATGKRVNSALDNAINFFTAQGLDNRANDLSGLLDSMSNAINTIQRGEQRHHSDHEARAVGSVAGQPGQANHRHRTQDTLSTQFDALLTQIGQLAGDSGFNGVNLLGGDSLTVNFNEDATSSTTITGVDYTNANASPLSINAAGNWQTSSNIDAGEHQPHRGSYHAAFGIADPQREPVDRADPPGLHEVDDQHAAERFGRPYAGGLERRRRELARLADTPAAVDHSAVALRAGRPERAAPVPISRSYRRRNGGLRAAVFFRAIQSWLTVS